MLLRVEPWLCFSYDRENPDVAFPTPVIDVTSSRIAIPTPSKFQPDEYHQLPWC